MTREHHPIDQPDPRPDQPDSTGAVPTAGEPLYINEEANSTRAPEPAPAPAQPPARQQEEPREEPQPEATKKETKVKGSVAGSTWAALIVGALLLIVLIVFILQNQQEVEITFLQWTVHFPAAIAYLLSAITGALIMALVGGWRMVELRRQVKRAKR